MKASDKKGGNNSWKATSEKSLSRKQAVTVTSRNKTVSFKVLSSGDLKRERNSNYRYLVK
jgi:hypothetical protein